MLALTAQVTSTIGLGIGVAVPKLRQAHVLATAVGTLNVYAPGRLRLGLGTGFTGALSIGARPTTWAQMIEHTQVVRGWLHGDEVTMTVDGVSRSIRHLHSNLHHLNTDDEVPIYISATGPRGLRVAGEIADGLWTISVDQRPTPEWLTTQAGLATTLAHEHGRANFPITLLTAAAVQGDGEPLDSDRLRSFLGPWVTTYLHSVFPIQAGRPVDEATLRAGQSSLNGPAQTDHLLTELQSAISMPSSASFQPRHHG